MSAPELGDDNPEVEWCPFCGEEIEPIEKEDFDPDFEEDPDDDYEEY
jgi:hypothetical protein